MKTCFKCRSVLPLSKFYAHAQMGDGHLGKCKSCTKRDVSEHRLANVKKARAYDLLRAKLPHRKALLARNCRRLHLAFPERTSARNKVSWAVKTGKLRRRPCCVCGSKKSLAHHEDYAKPLDVIWYCQPHHVARHKELKTKK